MHGPWDMAVEAARYLRERWQDERSESSRAFDEALGVSTSRWTLGGYEPTPLSTFDDIMAAIPCETAGATFVDVGAGKGRVLLLAARRPFDRVVGVEVDGALVDVAKENLRRADDPERVVDDVSVLHLDAAEVRWPLGPLVVFLYNPFPERVMAEMVAGLEDSLRAHPRPCFVAYLNPLFADVFLGGGWQEVASGGEGGLRWLWMTNSNRPVSLRSKGRRESHLLRGPKAARRESRSAPPPILP